MEDVLIVILDRRVTKTIVRVFNLSVESRKDYSKCMSITLTFDPNTFSILFCSL
ncbi:protein of unknown function [Candidatus Nitrosocosmicus franklandus]|uniref:Uncharacterized protein n=1 Tax=Candidatus Nitrosocosmicus franklandianus TaxID=1798806 RepID=A0A484ID33_9ARCH|nr:protein of unknown function [Candidatus Nitrosocosmicus franklandus]